MLTRIRVRQLAVIALFAGAITPLFNILTGEVSVRNALQGVVDAVLISAVVGGYLWFVRDGWARPWFRRLSFLADLALSSTIVLALFLVTRGLGQVVTTLDPARLVTSLTEAHLLYALPFFVLMAIGIQFVLQMNRLVGVNVLGYFATGTYRRPKAEDRIFLFIDLQDSTKLAETLGSARYFELLRRFVEDLTNPVLRTEGEIYQYAGDEIVVTWPMEAGVRAGNCVRCLFELRAAIERRSAQYVTAFGVLPKFRGGLHGGSVTAGELGDLKQQIVFVGDVLNTASRLEEYAKRQGLELVASGDLLDRVPPPKNLVSTQCGELEIRGKSQKVIAYSLREAGLAADGARG